MSKDFIKTVAMNAVSSVVPGASIASLLIDVASSNIRKSKEVADEGDPEKLRIEEVRQSLECRIAEYQARVAQEVAIARRIETAYEVEIEEFYDANGEGKLGLNVSEGEGINLGASGSGRKVTRRVYRFKGFAGDLSDDQFEQNLQEKPTNE
ncbi:hypothetical protein M6D81_11735 [Paenibacillus sp. J5C_2022]|uniref:hypothetical protein n=1 Tax=Paenibacillus sp. J5C2022 TaxID=2977129 RepID=UPI0021CF1497|nr:hypothetical protein [Paenibacillus sp. J5C2022]MCU6709378.1 hypothetical protein [Paenibacillus sp. J5C2022]